MSDATVVHCPDVDCPPVVVELSDSFGDVREVYLDYETANDLAVAITDAVPDERKADLLGVKNGGGRA